MGLTPIISTSKASANSSPRRIASVMAMMQLVTLISLVIIILLTTTANGLYYDEYPILPSYDKSIPQDVQQNFDIVGIVVTESNLQPNKQKLKTSTVGKYFTAGDYTPFKGAKLCNDDVSNTPAVFVAGTGFIVGSNRFMTAYHVAEDLVGAPPRNSNVGILYIVFGFRQKSTGALEKQYVYQVKQIYDESEEEDWIVLQTVKKFTHNNGNKFLLANSPPSVDQVLYILGDPLGMPLQYASGVVKAVDPNANIGLEFITSGFSGNSGSPVVRLQDGLVIGLFTAYDDDGSKNDFVISNSQNCYKFKITPLNNPVLVRGPLSSSTQASAMINMLLLEEKEELEEYTHKEL